MAYVTVFYLMVNGVSLSQLKIIIIALRNNVQSTFMMIIEQNVAKVWQEDFYGFETENQSNSLRYVSASLPLWFLESIYLSPHCDSTLIRFAIMVRVSLSPHIIFTNVCIFSFFGLYQFYLLASEQQLKPWTEQLEKRKNNWRLMEYLRKKNPFIFLWNLQVKSSSEIVLLRFQYAALHSG